MSSDKTNAQLFDGRSPIPVSGTLSIWEKEIVFLDETGSRRVTVDYNSINTCVKTQGGFKVTAKQYDHARKIAEMMIQCNDPALYDSVISKIPRRGINRLTPKSWKKRIILSLSLLAIFFTVGYLYMTQLYQVVPVSTEREIGDGVITGVLKFYPELKDDPQKSKLEEMTKKIAPADTKYQYRVIIVDTKDINAVSVPGGGIIVFKGLLNSAANDNEIEGVLAHEISHVEKRHGLRQMLRYLGLSFVFHVAGGAGLDQLQGIQTISDLSTLLVVFKYSRAFEDDADQNAVILLKKAGLSPKGLVTFLERMDKENGGEKQSEFLSTHPAAQNRISHINGLIGK
jgi:Zn-dependent protease with chaperone function